MRVASSLVQMSSQHESVKIRQRSESLRVWIGGEGTGRPAAQASVPASSGRISDLVVLSGQAQKALDAEAAAPVKNPITEMDELRMLLLQKVIEKLTGRKLKLVDLDKLRETCEGKNVDAPEVPPEQAPARAGWGLEYDYHETTYEYERMSFQSQGIITTTDGKEIEFSVDLGMSREFMEDNEIHVREGDAQSVDPLVINFGGTAPQLTQTKFSFDLDSDGRTDQISFVGSNSGFLALDRNEDGTINNGTELFGPTSGNGFSELAQYDTDGNNWIDESDPIYERLRVWTKDVDGNDQLMALGQRGIGAIYLGNVRTPFELKDSENGLAGTLRSTGVYVNENGSVGTIQQIDLTV